MLHVVFGAGQIGARLARHLAAAGHRVRVVRRSAAPVGEGIEVVQADARDPEAARRAAEGAAVVYHCMNPSAYTGAAWEAEFPALGEASIGAALANDARLVVLDNLYGYGVTDGPRTEGSPLAATGRKGLVRVAWDRRLRRAAAEQGLRWVAGRAGDFFGPGTADNSLMSPSMVQGLAEGRAAWLVGDAQAVHAFGYVPDVVRGLAALGVAGDDVEGQVFLLPAVQVAPAELVTALSAALGTSAGARALPGWLVSALGLVVPLFGELRETLYQWDRPFLVDDARFRARFPGLATDLASAVAQTAAEATVRAAA